MGGTASGTSCRLTSSQKKSHTFLGVMPLQCFSIITSPVLLIMNKDWIILPLLTERLATRGWVSGGGCGTLCGAFVLTSSPRGPLLGLRIYRSSKIYKVAFYTGATYMAYTVQIYFCVFISGGSVFFPRAARRKRASPACVPFRQPALLVRRCA